MPDTSAKEKVLSFSEIFISMMRHKDAAEALEFGAALLSKQNQPQEAYDLLKAACDLLKSNS